MSLANNLFINGYDAFTTWHMHIDPTTLSALMTPAGMKDNVKSSSRLSHGTSVSTSNVRKAARQVVLTLVFSAPDESTFMSRYASFCQQLETGFLGIWTKYQSDVYYRFEYNSCQQFTQFVRGIAKFQLRLTENDPSDRSLPSGFYVAADSDTDPEYTT